MTFLLGLLWFLLLLLVLLLFLPLSYGVRFSLGEKITYRAWGGSALLAFMAERGYSGSVFRLRLLGIPFRVRPGQEKKEKQPREGKKEKRSGFPWFLLKRENLKHIIRFCLELLAILKPKVFRLDIRAGFVEPEFNGMALAAFYSIKEMFPRFPLRFETVWEEETAEAKGEVAGRLVPAAVLWKVLMFVLSRPTLRMLGELRAKKAAAAAT